MITFTDKAWKVTKGALVIEKGEKVGTLYLCNGTSNFVNALTSKGADATLWHHRLEHMSENGMKILHSRNLLLGLKNVDLDFCENCIYGKQKRVRFLRVGKEKKSEKLELVNTNAWGPAQVSSLNGSHYYVTSLMMKLEKLGFIVLRIHLMYLILSRNGKLWLRLRQERN